MRRDFKAIPAMLMAGMAVFVQAQEEKVKLPYEEFMTIRDYYGPVMGARFFKGGNALVTCGKDKAVRTWELNGKPIGEMRGHKGWILKMDVNPAGTLAATVALDGTLRIWDLSGLAEVRSIEVTPNKTVNAGVSVAWHPTLSRVAVGMRDGYVQEYDTETGAQTFKKRAAGKYVSAVVYSPDGKQLVAAGHETATVFDLATGEKVRQLGKHDRQDVTCLAWSLKGDMIATGSADTGILIHDAKTGEKVSELYGHELGVIAIAFDREGRLLASAAGDELVNLWDAKGKALKAKLEGHKVFVEDVHFSPDGRMLVSCGLDGTIRLWDTSNGRELKKWKGHLGFIYNIGFSPDDALIAAAGLEFLVKLWGAKDGKPAGELAEGWDDIVQRIAFNPYRRGEVAVGSQNGRIKTWDYGSKSLDRDFVAHTRGVSGLAWMQGGKYLVSTGVDSYAFVWNIARGERVTEMGSAAQVFALATHPKDLEFAMGDAAGLVLVWRGDERKNIWNDRAIEASDDAVIGLAYSRDGALLAVASEPGQLKIYDARSHKLVYQAQNPAPVKAIAFSPDRKFLAVASKDNLARLWTLEPFAVAQELSGHLDEVTTVAFSSDGELLATAGFDGEIRIWQRQSK